ncbi:MAG TPA: YdeI/OmpD-associated family protein [Gemmatimonadaceae bacterium]|nr:YdeI/OmpD-associated family protein [Gemmatimonadaceae bacterium]
MTTTDPRIDAYIAKSPEFAKPILTHIRTVVHAACPDVEETMKWSTPHFYYDGQMLCGMAAFKEHAALSFWKAALIEGLGPESGGNSRGNLGKLRTVKDLAGKQKLSGYVKAAMKLNEAGITVKRPKAAPKPDANVPEKLAIALSKNKRAKVAFDTFAPGQRREYCEWIGEAKREETKSARVAQAIEWIAEGKTRNWKYQR